MTFQVTIEKESDIAGLSASQARKAKAERAELLHKVFEEAGADMDPAAVKIVEMKDGHALATWIRNANAELEKVGLKVAEYDELDKAKSNAERAKAESEGYEKDPSRFAPKGKSGDGAKPVFKSLGQLFVESKALQAARDHQTATFPIDDGDAAKAIGLSEKANFVTSAGWAPESLRTGRVALDEQREIEVTEHLPVFPTTQAAIVYMEETTFTNAAAERAEAAAYAESALALTQRSKTVRSVGTSLPVSDEQLEDVDGVRAYLDQRLGFMVRQRLDSQILVGDGVAPNLEGTLNVSGINTQALGADTFLDAIWKGLDLVRVTGRANASVAFVHPTDWQPVQLLKTADGIYIWGSPSAVGPRTVWGVPLVLTTAMTQNTAIVGDYARHSGLHVRKGLELQTGYVNDNFKNGMVTIRAGLRVAVVHYRPSAFTQITGV